VDSVARLAAPDRESLFQASAAELGLTPAIIEKDFWVCWMLKRVFTLPSPPADILFKGGTSLSKAFGLIERFSEDIDLVLDRHGLGFTGDRDPASQNISGKQRAKLIEELAAACKSAVHGQLLPMLRTSVRDSLGTDEGTGTWKMRAAEDDPDGQTILFAYPQAQPNISAYVRPQVRLELGARGDHWPAVDASVEPYSAKTHPRPFADPTAIVRVLSPERTFWEKATILHAIHHRPIEKPLGERQSRHYYDLARLAASSVGQAAAKDHDLLNAVAAHKDTFFRVASAKYAQAKPGTLRLVPPPSRMATLRADYAAMQEMLFGRTPTWDEIIAVLTTLESTINS
jgi:hypothetical protein